MTFSGVDMCVIHRSVGFFNMKVYWRWPRAQPVGECLLPFFDQDSLSMLSPWQRATGFALIALGMYWWMAWHHAK